MFPLTLALHAGNEREVTYNLQASGETVRDGPAPRRPLQRRHWHSCQVGLVECKGLKQKIFVSVFFIRNQTYMDGC